MRIIRKDLNRFSRRIKPRRTVGERSQPVPVISLPSRLEPNEPSNLSNQGDGNVAHAEIPRQPLNIVILGLSITSSWGNGHATTYRSLARELHARGHHVLFLERDVEWYAANRDLSRPSFAEVGLYSSLSQLKSRYEAAVRQADAVVVDG
jgi:signal recognition particle GTPase